MVVWDCEKAPSVCIQAVQYVYGSLQSIRDNGILAILSWHGYTSITLILLIFKILTPFAFGMLSSKLSLYLLDASRMKRVCSVAWTSVASEARKAMRWSCSWKKEPMMQKAA